MMGIIKIQHDKAQELSYDIEQMLKFGGMAMTCITEIMRESGMDERNGMYPQYREGGMDYRYPHMQNREGYPAYREEEHWQEPMYRQGVKGTGRYSRY